MKKPKKPADSKKFKITNREKVFFANPKYTKGDIIRYYKKIFPYMLPLIKDRPANMVRAPDGMLGDAFYQQNIPKYFPDWIKRFDTFRIKGGFAHHPIIDSENSLLYLVNNGALTFHIWNSKIDNIKKPDRIIFDFDPPDATRKSLESLKRLIWEFKDSLEKQKLHPLIMTTGSKGYHVVVFIKPNEDFKTVKAFAKEQVGLFEKKYPTLVTANFLKSKRKNKIFIDYLRNNYGQTAVAPYSVRLKRGAPIACPIFWNDLLKKDFYPQTINIKNVFQYLRKGNPWK